MSELAIYVIELENGKWFLHATRPNNDPYYIMMECEILNNFAQQNKPKRVAEKMPINDVLDIDLYVKKFMKIYGVDNVRGGNYSAAVLSNQILEFLRNEIFFDDSKYQNNSVFIETIVESYRKNSAWKKEDIENEKKRLVFDLVEFQKTQKKYNDIRYSGGYEIAREFLYDLDWMLLMIEDTKQNEIFNFSLRKHSAYKVEKYTNVIRGMRLISAKYFSLEKCVDAYDECYIYYKNPEFIFDRFFYHPHTIIDWTNVCEEAEKLLKTFRHFLIFIMNRVDEYEFDLSTYSDNIEETTKYVLKYLEYLVTDQLC
jgi:hypothetical protein